MRKIFIILIFIGILFQSCEPMPAGEGIDLPPMNFGFKVYPDTSHIKIGDTITLSASISSTLSNGIKINDGKATIGGTISFTNDIPITVPNFQTSMMEEYLYIYSELGNYDLNVGRGLGNIYAILHEDSIKIKLRIVPHKIGTYRIQLFSKFFEGSKGKTRTESSFEMENTHWNLWQVAEHPAPNKGDENYYKTYNFAVIN